MVSTSDVLMGRIPRRATQVRPLTPTAFEVKEGNFLQISDVQGKQVASFVAFKKDDPGEYLSTSRTRTANNSLMLINGMKLYSNRGNPMLALLEDTVGRHDMLFPACDARGYQEDYGLDDHPGCRENLVKALEPWGVDYDHIPDPVNWFMNVGLKARGEFEVREPLSERSDYVLMRVLMDLVVAVSACPQDQSAANAFKPTDILVRVYQ